MKRDDPHFNLGVILFSLLVCIGIVIPPTSYAIPLADFTGHSENLSSVVNFAVLPPGDQFTSVLAPVFQGGKGSSAGLNPSHFTYLYQLTNQLSPSPFSQLIEFGIRGHGEGRVSTVGTFNGAGLRVDFLDQGRLLDGSGLRGINSLGLSGCNFSQCLGDGPGGDLDGAKNFGLAVRNMSSPVNVRTVGRGLNWQFSGFASGLTSPVFGYQSPDGPGFAFAGERFLLGVGETMGVPGATAPEPLSLLLVASGLIPWIWWRERLLKC
ncbi:MAG TPA: hypothetical protein VJ805_00225 [Nitrospiraceae bacterium]|nr:hypothetical protein [Nitrospiraceae bacterium]